MNVRFQRGMIARLVRPSIEAAFDEICYAGPVSITAYADHKEETPNHVLLALSSTGVDVAHTSHGFKQSVIYEDVWQWTENNPAPASLMLISNDVHPYNETPLLISRCLQEKWLWESLLAAVSEEKTKHILLHKCRSSESSSSAAGMFYCKLCNWDDESLDDFNKHFSSGEHAGEENRISSRIQNVDRSHMQAKISDYHHEVWYSRKNKRMRK